VPLQTACVATKRRVVATKAVCGPPTVLCGEPGCGCAAGCQLRPVPWAGATGVVSTSRPASSRSLEPASSAICAEVSPPRAAAGPRRDNRSRELRREPSPRPAHPVSSAGPRRRAGRAGSSSRTRNSRPGSAGHAVVPITAFVPTTASAHRPRAAAPPRSAALERRRPGAPRRTGLRHDLATRHRDGLRERGGHARAAGLSSRSSALITRRRCSTWIRSGSPALLAWAWPRNVHPRGQLRALTSRAVFGGTSVAASSARCWRSTLRVCAARGSRRAPRSARPGQVARRSARTPRASVSYRVACPRRTRDGLSRCNIGSIALRTSVARGHLAGSRDHRDAGPRAPAAARRSSSSSRSAPEVVVQLR